MAILTASVKLYLRLEDEAEDLVTKVLKMATDDSDNPDLRNRGYIYWRMLSDGKSTRLNSSHIPLSRMPSSA